MKDEDWGSSQLGVHGVYDGTEKEKRKEKLVNKDL